MKIIEYSSNRAKEITDLFYMSVNAIDSSVYSEEQKKAWAPLPIDYVAWEERLECKSPYLLLINQQIAGFIELDPDGHIDCTYVSPLFQRRGVAAKLLKHVILLAESLGLKELYVEASIVAKPLFEKHGFQTECRNEFIRNNVVLVNYSMRMAL